MVSLLDLPGNCHIAVTHGYQVIRYVDCFDTYETYRPGTT